MFDRPGLEAMGFPAAESISIYDQYGIDGERESSLYVELWKSPTVPAEADGDLMAHANGNANKDTSGA